jgi:hypothetical protein
MKCAMGSGFARIRILSVKMVLMGTSEIILNKFALLLFPAEQSPDENCAIGTRDEGF